MAPDPLDDWKPPGGGADPLDAYAPPPKLVRDAPRGPGPWADEYVGARPGRPKPTGLVDPTVGSMAVDPGVDPKPTADEEKEFNDAGLSTKLWRLLKGDLPHQRASGRYFDAFMEKNPGWKAVPQLESAAGGAITAGFGAGLAGMGLKALAGVGPAISTGSRVLNAAVPIAARIGSAGIEGGVGGAIQGGMEARDEGQPVLPAAAEGFKGGAVVGTALGAGGEAASASGRTLANFIKGGKGTTGQDIRLLEKYGYTPGPPIPGKPVTRLQDMPGRAGPGPALPRSPSEAFGVEATPAGRGETGARSVVEMKDELARRDARSAALLKAQRARNNRPGGQGEREISTEPLIATAAGEAASPAGELMPGIGSNMNRSTDFLRGKLEPTQSIRAWRPAEGQTVGGQPRIDLQPLDEFATRRRREGPYPFTFKKQDPWPEQRGHVGQVEEPLAEPYERTIRPEETGAAAEAGGPGRITVDRLEREGDAVTRQGSQRGGPKITIPMGDIRGRTGDLPNHYRSARELDQMRDVLDEMSNVAEREGMTKKNLPMAKVADQIRAQLREHAPDVASANARAHARMNQTERAKELMRDEQSFGEAFGGQLAAQGEQGSRIAGTRVPRMGDLRKEFPARPGFPRQKVQELMDRAPLLAAEERMTPKNLALRGPIGGNVLNVGEPLLARGVYPAARALQAAGVDLPIGLLSALAQAQRARNEDTKKKKAAR